MAFAVPESSSPPSTPGGQTPGFFTRPSFSSLANHPSTTPAGPPPSSANSFTPSGPPPPSVFGSSQPGTGVSKLRFSRAPNDQSLFESSTASRSNDMTGGSFKFSNNGHSFAVPHFRRSGYSTVHEEDYDDAQGDMYGMDEDVDAMGETEEQSAAGTPAFKGFMSVNNGLGTQNGSSMFSGRPTPSAAVKSRLSASARKSQRSQKPSNLPGNSKASVIPGIAKDFASRCKDASLFEPDEMILGTEVIISQVTEAVQERGLLPEVKKDILSRASSEALKLWSQYTESYPDGRFTDKDGVGPGESASPISKATFISSLLLSLHHPPIQEKRQPPWNPTTRSMAIIPFTAPQPVSMPQVLLDWLEKHHISVDGALNVVRSAEPNCTAHELFWETILGLLIRGKLKEIIQLFNQADFRHADTALDDGEEEPGYHGAQLQSIQGVVSRARQILETSPAMRHGNWQVNDSDWSMFRKKVESELEYLADAAEGPGHDEEDSSSSFQAENFGIRDTARSLSESARRAQSNVPWTVYENLKIFYRILLGSSAEIIAQSQDWLEATLALAVWWDGTQDENIASWSLSVSRQSVRPTGVPEDPYLSRLSAAFLSVTDPEVADSFQINTLSPTEVALASVLQGCVEGVIGILKSWSLVIASAVAEIGAISGWVSPTLKSNAAPSGLDDQDLMVLSYGQDLKGISKDDILRKYSEELFEKEEMIDHGELKEGWELAIIVATRLNDRDLAKQTISHLLDELHLDSQDRMDKLVILCTDLGLEDQARSVSERFADHLVSTTTLYGPAMICFARAHSTNKLRTLISLLVSYSLVSSVAYPLDSELDPSLSALLHNPKAILSNIAEIDPEAASLLQFHLTGYAALRKYYSLRDAQYLPQSSRPSTLRQLARTRLAAKYLIAVINSAADSIYGGLYDPQRESAIQVDGLLTLLGEATSLLAHNNGKPIFDKSQIFDLLRATEDLQTCLNSRVYSACEECLKATIRNATSSNQETSSNVPLPPNPMDMLKKSVSSGSGSNLSFSMMGSEMLSAGDSNLLGSDDSGTGSTGSGVLIGSSTQNEGDKYKIINRGWDWRTKFAKQQDVNVGNELVNFLRRELAVELSLAGLRN